jgi:hypothetical protein
VLEPVRHDVKLDGVERDVELRPPPALERCGPAALHLEAEIVGLVVELDARRNLSSVAEPETGEGEQRNERLALVAGRIYELPEVVRREIPVLLAARATPRTDRGGSVRLLGPIRLDSQASQPVRAECPWGILGRRY